MSEEICSICKSPAEGIRFGAPSCQACSAFFRRSIAESKEYICQQSSNCEIDQKQRNHCRACRLKKCFSAGMKKELVNDTKTNFSDFPSASPSTPPSTSNGIGFIGNNYNAYVQSQKSLFRLHFATSKEQFLNTELEFQPVTREQHNLMEQGNASLVANFLMDTFPTFNNLSQDEKHTIFGPLAARLNHFHRCILTMRFVDDCSNEKVVLHYGFYYSLDTFRNFYGKELIPNEEEIIELVYPLMVRMRELSKKLKSLDLNTDEIGAIIALIYYAQIEKNRLWTLEAADSRNVIFSQLHYEVVKRHGFEKGGIKFGQIVNLLFDIELLAADFSNVRILRKLLMKGGDDVFMLEDDSLLK